MSTRRPIVVIGVALAALGGVLVWSWAGGPAEAPGVATGTESGSAAGLRSSVEYHETLGASRYDNQDLEIQFSIPAGWEADLGPRTEDTAPYEGLVVKVQPKAADGDGPATKLGPFISVIKETLECDDPREPVAYVTRHLLGPEKKVVEEAAPTKLGKKDAARVVYEMGDGNRTLRIEQYVQLRETQAIILTAMAPVEEQSSVRAAVEEFFASLTLGD